VYGEHVWRCLLAVTTVAACTYPDVGDGAEGAFKCDEQNECPDGEFCRDQMPRVCAKIGAVGCAGQPIDHYWEFSKDPEAWAFDAAAGTGSSAAVRWISDEGKPELGAIGTEFTSTLSTQTLGWFAVSPGPGDMKGKIVSGRIWADHPGLIVKAHATNGSAGWIDNGDVHIPEKTWTCVSLDIDHPMVADPMFDPTRVVYVGFQIDGTAPMRVLIDDVGY
jgi:hypothetical protein